MNRNGGNPDGPSQLFHQSSSKGLTFLVDGANATRFQKLMAGLTQWRREETP